MAQVVNRKGEVVDIPDEQVKEAFDSGQYGLIPGQDYKVQTELGTVGTVQGAKAPEAFAAGAESASAESFRKAEVENKYGGVGGAAASFGINAADALTLGAGKGLATGAAGLVGGEQAEEATRQAIRGYDEANPKAAIAGQVVGTAAPLVLGGVGGLVGKGARGAGGLVRGLDAAGGAAERGAMSLLGGESTSLLARAGQKAAAFGARGVVEGAAYGTGQAFSEEMLSGGDHELTAEKLLAGAERGAILGGAIGGVLGGGTTLIGGGIEKLAEAVVPKLRDKIEAFAQERAFKAAGGSKRFWSKAQDRAGGVEEIAKDLLERGHITPSSTAESIYESVAKDKQAVGAKLGDMMRDLDTKAVENQAVHFASGDTIIRKAYDEVINPLRSNPALRSTAEALENKLAPFVNDYAGKEVGFQQLWDHRRGLDKLINWESRAGSPAVQGIKDFRNILEGELVDSGERAAQEMGGSFAKGWKENKRLYSSLSFAENMAEDGVARKEGNRFFSPTDYLAGGFGANSFAAGHEAGMGLHTLVNPAAAASGVLTAAIHKIARERGSSVLASAAHSLAQIGSSDMAKVADKVAGVDASISKSLGAFVREGAEKAERVALPTTIEASEKYKPKTPQERFAHTVQQVASYTTNQDLAAQKIQKTLGPLGSVAPKVAQAAASRQLLKTKFLQEKVPRPAAAPKIQGAPIEHLHSSVSNYERDTFMAYVDAVEKGPEGIAEDMGKGKIPPPEAGEALAATSPKLFEQMKQEIFTHVADLAAEGKEMPYQKSLQLAGFVGAPLDETMAPDYVADIQAVYETSKQQAPQAGAAGARGGGTKRKLDVADDYATKTEKLA